MLRMQFINVNRTGTCVRRAPPPDLRMVVFVRSRLVRNAVIENVDVSVPISMFSTSETEMMIIVSAHSSGSHIHIHIKFV